jgi:hypothetical protein
MDTIGVWQGGLLRGFGVGRVNFVCLVALALASSTPARGDFIGDATGPGSAADTNGTCFWMSTIRPVPAVLETGQDAKLNALILGAINEAGFNAANGWTVTAKGLSGSFTVDTYYAWVTDQPSISKGGVTSVGNDHGEIGGAAFALLFDRGPLDPLPADTHWMQIVVTNAPGVGGFDAGDGVHALVDNNGSKTDPTYDGNGGAANAFVFIDVPHDICPPNCNYSADWRFVTFIVTRDVDAKTLVIYEKGVEWGYDFSCSPAPEPASVLIGLSALPLLLVVGVRRRARSM